MLLPSTYFATLLLMIVTMLCWGSWANTQKLTGKWRFELFCFDYAFGVIAAAAILAFTFGTLGFDGFSTVDDILRAGKKQEFFGFVGGCVFNLANMLLVAAISIAGMSVAFPVAIGLALIIGVVLNYAIDPGGNPVLLFTGAGIVGVAIILSAMAYHSFGLQKMEEEARAGLAKSTRLRFGMKGIVISVISGVLMGSFFPIVQLGVYRDPQNENGLGPYAIGLIFAVGVVFSTFVYNLFFTNLPLEGKPISIFDYFSGTVKQHALGVIGGMIWGVGTVCNFVAASAQAEARVGPAVSYGFGQGATLIGVLWGLLYWKEFKGANGRVRMLLGVMIAAFVIGLAMVSMAPLVKR